VQRHCSVFAEPEATTDLVTSVLAVSLSILYWVSRLGFENPPALVIATLGSSLFLLLLPRGVRLIGRRLGVYRSSSVLGTDAALSLVGLLMLAGVGMLRDAIGVNLLPAFAAAGILLVLGAARAWWRATRTGGSAVTMLAGLCLAIYLSGLAWQDDFNTLFYENLLLGVEQTDTLFHASILNMIGTYGVPSTGLDGPAYVPYHFGSHWLFAAVSKLLGVDGLKFYELAFPVILFPFLIKSILIFVREVGAWTNPARADAGGRTQYAFWLVFFAGLAGLLPGPIHDRLGLPLVSLFVSESQTVAMALAFCTMTLGLSACRVSGVAPDQLRVRPPALVLAMLPLLVGATAIVKIPVGLLLLCVVYYLVARLRLYRYAAVWASCALATGIVLAITLTVKTTGPMVVAPFAYLRFNVEYPWQLLWFPAFLAWPLVYGGFRMRAAGIRTMSDLKEGLTSRSLLDLEVLAVVYLAATMPALFFYIKGSSASYFMDLPRWLAMAFVMALLPRMTISLEHLRTSRLKTAVFVGAVPVAVSLAINVVTPLVRFARANLVTRHSVAEGITYTAGIPQRERPSAAHSPVTWARYRRVLRQAVTVSPGSLEQLPQVELFGPLRQLAQLTGDDKRATALFIPRTNAAYWGRHRPCTVPFLAPAVTGIAMLDGIPADQCATAGYGYAVYFQADEPRPVETLSVRLCRKARRMGASRVALLAVDGGGRSTTDWLSCS
jgi:hypothetical protein